MGGGHYTSFKTGKPPTTNTTAIVHPIFELRPAYRRCYNHVRRAINGFYITTLVLLNCVLVKIQPADAGLYFACLRIIAH